MRLGIGVSEDLPLATQQLLATHVESAGYASLWTNEASGRDALLVCQAWAAATTDLDVGVGVAPVWTRTPAQLAMASATLQEVSGGRFLLGLGVSHPGTMGPWHGVRFRRPLTAAAELLEILSGAERGEPTDLEGEVFASRRLRLGITPSPPPTRRYLGAMGPRMLRLAGRAADGVLLNWSGPGEVRRAVELVREGAREAGRDPSDVEIAAYVRCAVSADVDAARGSLARQIGAYGALPAYESHFARQGLGDAIARARQTHRDGGGAGQLAEALGADALRELGWAGAPTDDPGSWLEEFERAGLEHLIARVVVVGDDPVESVRSVVAAFDRFTV